MIGISIVPNQIPGPGLSLPGSRNDTAFQPGHTAHCGIYCCKGSAVAHAMAQKAVGRGNGGFQFIRKPFHQKRIQLTELLAVRTLAADIQNRGIKYRTDLGLHLAQIIPAVFIGKAQLHHPGAALAVDRLHSLGCFHNSLRIVESQILDKLIKIRLPVPIDQHNQSGITVLKRFLNRGQCRIHIRQPVNPLYFRRRMPVGNGHSNSRFSAVGTLFKGNILYRIGTDGIGHADIIPSHVKTPAHRVRIRFPRIDYSAVLSRGNHTLQNLEKFRIVLSRQRLPLVFTAARLMGRDMDIAAVQPGAAAQEYRQYQK